ncbi:zinc finger (C3HC4 type RING finger) protein [Reticulomyxa filosa]|uniref:Zinc finger (C3HC4 type RING finger) protein n=1 Tax=Reticulomyxa filosa TaxID=46433 RepID=X6NA26_RETFI|nr:zinc finger (C3HC4 type RING finger) protein [Reticulomyxa filosa]|eukprot:ETO23150.1 zinc finger (C3HC4 type RING finger) protein [Reticulomyxa filosa]
MKTNVCGTPPINSEAEGQEREKECRHAALEAIQALPKIFNLPYHLKFEGKGMAVTEKQIHNYGNVQSTNLSLKTPIREFCCRDSDSQWIKGNVNPSSSSSSSSSSTSTTSSSSSSLPSSLAVTNPPRVSIAAASAIGAGMVPFAAVAPTTTTVVKPRLEPEEKSDFSWDVKTLEWDNEKKSVLLTFTLTPPDISLLESYELDLQLLEQDQSAKYACDVISVGRSYIAVNESKGIFRLNVPILESLRAGVLHVEGLLRDQDDVTHTYPIDGRYLTLGEIRIPQKNVVISKTLSSLPSSSSSFSSSSLTSPRSNVANASDTTTVLGSTTAKSLFRPSPSPKNVEPVAPSNSVLFSVDFNKVKKTVPLPQTNLTLSCLREQIAIAFDLDDPKALKLSSKKQDGTVLEKKLEKDAMIANFDTHDKENFTLRKTAYHASNILIYVYIYVRLSFFFYLKKAPFVIFFFFFFDKNDIFRKCAPIELKILLFPQNGKRVKYILKDPTISFAAFKEAIRQKIKMSNDFVIEIASGENANKIIENDQHIALLNFNEGEMEVRIIAKQT